MEKIVEVLPDKEGLIERGLQLILTKIERAICDRGICTIALAGGSTPKPLYGAIATQDLPWDKIHVFWGDERYVSGDHPDSNQRMARQAWLDKVDIPASNIHPIPTDGETPAADASKHETQLQEFFGIEAGEFPQFDVILLGIGDDAHTASLFPHTEALAVQNHLVAVGNKDGQPRITFTAPLINQARWVIFLVAGASKRPALAQIFAPDANPLTYPARLIQPQEEMWWLLDGEAGAGGNFDGGR
ncbi:MAG TPA: 6-phosphogluconolactonase [Cyanobacteria bacterium UBA11149]|nr:6-phosphogluconolactonase [Cyanobacteria bacterium UBA11367]HBE57312.1 6-phosphogluconolactonase [Cyanobacteria bacterium UBA11366]HBK66104.1 6-phosphogluconolactonase [Cyanobacteria bacterium UBA11166]HBR77231.1 6-phosphogluconolactonase [Cyanobacteria bacterium UBA11159]HBS67671.1 6-phosphogluconolactonase [Cyanobacteria bacterium UBA11153]HBW92164.1 6-phosphogluconolactonase [Cyanobacteria bacterium UBA11149]HCA96136.1 6-phosphogluconolactonase [Cyanobacteria bacterium UBA9226]